MKTVLFSSTNSVPVRTLLKVLHLPLPSCRIYTRDTRQLWLRPITVSLNYMHCRHPTLKMPAVNLMLRHSDRPTNFLSAFQERVMPLLFQANSVYLTELSRMPKDMLLLMQNILKMFLQNSKRQESSLRKNIWQYQRAARKFLT